PMLKSWHLTNEVFMSSFAGISPLFLCSEAPRFADSPTEYAASFPHWPRVLNYPPAASFSINALMKIAKTTATPSNPNPESFGMFKEFIQGEQSARHETVELVFREVLETAKTHLGKIHWKLYHAAEVMQDSAHLTAFGGALITIGVLGVYLTQPEPVAADEAPKRNWTRILFYGATVTGLALIALATYRLQASANLIMKNFELVN
ncbi:MAG TPA: hypothetical protein VIJ14_06645, partial [Rhabdochlamydiaceae bacterium]